jgi:hypothetical protein
MPSSLFTSSALQSPTNYCVSYGFYSVITGETAIFEVTLKMGTNFLQGSPLISIKALSKNHLQKRTIINESNGALLVYSENPRKNWV